MDDQKREEPRWGAWVIFGLGLVWLVAILWNAHDSVLGNSDNAFIALGDMAAALPGVVAAALVAGASAGLAVTGAFSWTRVRPLVTGVVTGALLGAICGGLVRFEYGPNVTRLAVTVAIGGLVGGAMTVLPRAVLASGLIGTLSALGLGVVFARRQGQLVGLFGGNDTLDSQANASYAVAYVQAIVCAIVAGLLAYWFLRRYGSRAWPWYLLAGALAGLLLLVSELITRTGGASLFSTVQNFSEGDRIVVDANNFARIRNGMVVMFVGGLAAMIAVGRTLRSASTDDAEQSSGDASQEPAEAVNS